MIAIRLLHDRVLGSEGYAARTDHDHDEEVKVSQVDQEVAKLTDPAS